MDPESDYYGQPPILASPQGRHHNAPPPRVARKTGKSVVWWPTDEGSLASRSIGKVHIDCRLRLSESKWGLLDGSQPAGILYVDLSFDQPRSCRLSSATVLISLEQYDDAESDKKKPKEKDEVSLSRLRVCEFGPKLLTGEPTTLKRRTEYNFTPEVNAGIGGFGGLGVKRHNSISYVSRWVLKGSTLAPADKKRKTPGIVYRTLKWELTENELAFQPTDRSVVHTAFAFEHELKRFYIKVEISGKLTDALDRFKHRMFPPRMKRDQGTLFTLVDLGAEADAHKNSLDHLARKLEAQMRERNLIALPTKLLDHADDPPHQTPKPPSLEEDPGLVDLADLAKAADKFAPASEPTRTLQANARISTPAPSFISTAETVVASSNGDKDLYPPLGPTNVKDPPVSVPQGEDEKPNATDMARPVVEKVLRDIAEVQFIEVLIVLRAWAYATFLAIFLRNPSGLTVSPKRKAGL
ncbi:hypothetical protein B0H66DRAFT_565885 [Apodospora peruviana]|uniref:Uncharacterized protein n=1 Tax=Apodospora peruviana TaxID=516989 RepID=A0AAE0HWN9_9PEZI|nr:hypothetical protein B0H66DRAFT_565885 [Apodospora peruviana]